MTHFRVWHNFREYLLGSPELIHQWRILSWRFTFYHSFCHNSMSLQKQNVQRATTDLYDLRYYSRSYLAVCVYIESYQEASGCMLYRLSEDKCIMLPEGITLIIQGLQTWGYEIVSYHKIGVLESNKYFYPLLCLILRPAWDLKIMLIPVNSKEHPVLEL